MLKKDRLILEKLTNRYGRKNICLMLNEKKDGCGCNNKKHHINEYDKNDIDYYDQAFANGDFDGTFNQSVYEDGYDEGYNIGYNNAKQYRGKIEPIDFKGAQEIASDLVDEWGTDVELEYDREFIKEILRGVNDGINDYLEENKERRYSRRDNEFYRRHHLKDISESAYRKEFLSEKEILENIYDVLSNNTQYITSKDFASIFPNMEINYDDNVIDLKNGMYLKLVDKF